MKLLFFLLANLFFNSVFSLDVSSATKSFDFREEFYTENMDFKGSFPDLEVIDVDARRQKRVALNLPGEYPVLKTIRYEGSFGYLSASFLGDFPSLESMQYLCTACSVNLDLRGSWTKNCHIIVKNRSEPVVIKLPADIGIIVRTRTTWKGKVNAVGLETRKNGLRKKVFVNSCFSTSNIILDIEIETVDGGNITLVS